MYSLHLTVANLVLQIVDIFSNIFACKFIKHTFNIHQSLYRILWIDSITIIITLISILLVNITIFVSSIQYGHIGCFILGYLSHLGFYISPILTFLISFIRFLKLNNPESGWKPNEYILKIIQWTVFGSYLYYFCLAISSVVFHHGAFVNNFYVCVKEEPPEYKTGLSITASLVLGSLFLAILLSVALDIFSLLKLRKLEKTRNQIQPEVNIGTIATINTTNTFPERKICDEIPIRSSLVNTLFLLLYVFMIIFVGIIGTNFAKQEYRALMEMQYHLMTICRTWLVATLTFKKNDANRQRNADEERERMRQIEIHDAMRKRQEMLLRISTNLAIREEGGDDPSSEINESEDDDTLRIGSELPIIGRTIRVRPSDCHCGAICSLDH